MHTAFIALGANLGEPLQTLRWAKNQLSRLGQLVESSSLYRTAPVGGPEGQPPYLNGAVSLKTSIEPQELLEQMHQLEAKAGRQRRERWEARILDLDLILYDDLQLQDPMQIPHPRAWERAFVLVPLAEMNPDLSHPINQMTVAEALAQLDISEVQSSVRKVVSKECW